jgi:YrbI family 3-deoxy-D-manno-octulosonate 8-phosphate phosphatase
MARIIGLVPLRGGSKRISFKNIKEIAGKPLAYWVCRAAKESHHISEVYVSTEDEIIRQVVESFDLGIQVLERPRELATDTTTTDSVILEFMKTVDFDLLATIQATSPLTSPHDLDCAIQQLLRNGNDSLLTGVLTKRFFWTLDGVPLNYDFLRRPFTQEFGGSVMENGAFYLTKREALEKYQNRLGGKIGIYIMPEETATELDEPDDWRAVERLLLKRPNAIRRKLGALEIIVSDFDGVWTDNKVSVDARGWESLSFSKEDSLGLDLFRQQFSTPLIVVSKERNGIVRERCKKLGLPVLHSVDDKSKTVEAELAKRGLNWSGVCYIGNDKNDLECITRAGLSFCPCDAVLEVKSQVSYVLGRSGGHGAIREMLELFQSLSSPSCGLETTPIYRQ